MLVSAGYAQHGNVLEEVETGSFAPLEQPVPSPSSIRIVVWNIERGLQLPTVIEFLRQANPDVVLLQEVDLNARRTQYVDVAREIAQKLKMNYVFGREFEELTQGSRTSPAYHGQATLSRWPLSNARLMRFHEQSNFWHPHWYLPRMELLQQRLGGRMALVCEVNVPGQKLVAYNLHLESRGNDDLRRAQLMEVLDDTQRYLAEAPLIVAGDMNFDLSQGPASESVRDAQFRNDLAQGVPVPTAPSSFLRHGRPIDWILTRGPVQDAEARVYRSVDASDHFPLSLTLTFQPRVGQSAARFRRSVVIQSRIVSNRRLEQSHPLNTAVSHRVDEDIFNKGGNAARKRAFSRDQALIHSNVRHRCGISVSFTPVFSQRSYGPHE